MKHWLSSLPPGVLFLVDNVFSVSFLAPASVLAATNIFYTRFSLHIPNWLSALSCLVSLPLVFAGRIIWKSFADEREAARMGARMAPVMNGKLPGNLDILMKFLNGSNNDYPGEALLEWMEHLNSNTFNLRLLWEDFIVTTEPEYIKTILSTDFHNYVKGERFQYAMESVLGSGVFNADGDMWKFHRSMTRPFFTHDRISHFDIFDRHAEDAIARMKDRFESGYAVDIQDLISRFTLDSTTEFLFGKDVRSLASPLPFPYTTGTKLPSGDIHLSQAEQFSRAFAQSQQIIADRSRTGEVWPLLEIFGDQTKKPMEVVNGYIEPILREALEKRKTSEKVIEGDKYEVGEGETLLDHLVKYTSDPVVLKDEILNIMIAGKDTTAVTMTCAIYLLAMHPSVLSKLRSEILERVGPHRRPTYDDIKEMKYLRAVLNETLRLFPPVPFNVRDSVNATTWPSCDPTQKPIYIPAGTTIPYSVFLMHRRTDLWGPDADEFDPERFIDTRLKKYLVPNPFIFLPFNAGPRICLGQQFAYNEMSFMLIRLFQTFSSVTLSPSSHVPGTLPPPEWSSARGRKGIEKFWPKSHLTMYSLGGLWVNMEEKEV
ncbi:hypothetical protein JAAARDRAFT_611408 [Jaapia argillacea MUCL 33604]|uniref:Cytochrome P450 monooxygenase pc-3 n=1 Tax=Jaapia argillacea MUCL 33604 TaxID=933084 RepID=A0A067P841_9AGAM|nr:hypothetical protein JAAARDRAFT_611408 [Jaapia argillacea MUCL 33604]